MADITDLAIDAALARGAAARQKEPRANAIRYDAATRRIVVSLATRIEMMVPVHLLEGLAGATDSQIAEVELLGDGYGLHWESLDVALTVPGIISGIFGSARWMAELEETDEGAAPSQGKRRFGALKDKIAIDAPFDEPLPDDGTMGPKK